MEPLHVAVAFPVTIRPPPVRDAEPPKRFQKPHPLRLAQKTFCLRPRKSLICNVRSSPHELPKNNCLWGEVSDDEFDAGGHRERRGPVTILGKALSPTRMNKVSEIFGHRHIPERGMGRRWKGKARMPQKRFGLAPFRLGELPRQNTPFGG